MFQNRLEKYKNAKIKFFPLRLRFWNNFCKIGNCILCTYSILAEKFCAFPLNFRASIEKKTVSQCRENSIGDQKSSFKVHTFWEGRKFCEISTVDLSYVTTDA